MRNSVLKISNTSYSAGLALRDSWWRLRVESCALRERGLARGTWANKVSHLHSYICFTTHYGVQDFPIQPGVLLRFIALLSRGSLSSESAANILSSVKYFASFLDPPSTQVFEKVHVSASMKGLKAQLSRPVHQKLPISVDHLIRFHGSLDLSHAKHLAAWCGMLLAFFGCLRLSNLVPTAHSDFDPLKHLKRDDISCVDNLVLVYYKWSKTNQNTSKVSWIPISAVADSRFNIKVHFENLLKMVKVPDNAPLFSYAKDKFHTRYSLVNLLDSCVLEAGLSPADYSWHSFRRGAAVFAFELGLADSAVQLLGDWSSSAFKSYLEFSFLRKVSVTEAIASNFELCIKEC